MKHLFLLGLIVLVGCKPIVTQTSCPDGSKCFAIDCHEAEVNNEHASCLAAFGNSCPNGYDILDKDVSGYNFLIKCHDKPKVW